jgi:hypothetical protein
MKSRLLILSLVIPVISFSQKKLIANTYKLIQLDSSITTYDSTSYIYMDWQGSIASYKPEIIPDSKEFIQPHFNHWTFIPKPIPCNLEKRYSLLPFQLQNVATKTINNDRVIESNSDNSILIKYDYNNEGQLIKHYKQGLFSGNWQTTDSTTFNYDSLGNRILVRDYSFNSGIADLYSIDSSFFNPGTNQLIKGIGYTYLDTNIFINSETVAYSGTQINHVDQFSFDPTQSQFVWTSRETFDYLGSDLVSANYFFVNNNIQDSIENGSYHYYYDTQSKLITTTLYIQGEIQDSIIYEYESPEFISKSTRYIRHLNGTSFFRAEECEYFYQNTLDLDRIETVQLVISPNPTSDYLEIQTSENLKKVEVYNTSGQLLIRQNMAKIDVRNLPNGTYVLKGSTDKGSFSETIIKR